MTDLSFIQLTLDTGEPVWFRIDTIETFHQDGSLTAIITEEKPWHVRQSPESVIELITKAVEASW